MILNVYAPNNRESTQKPKKLKEEIDKFTLYLGLQYPTIGNFNLLNSEPARIEN